MKIYINLSRSNWGNVWGVEEESWGNKYSLTEKEAATRYAEFYYDTEKDPGYSYCGTLIIENPGPNQKIVGHVNLLSKIYDAWQEMKAEAISEEKHRRSLHQRVL